MHFSVSVKFLSQIHHNMYLTDTSGKSSLTAHNESEKLVLKKASNDV